MKYFFETQIKTLHDCKNDKFVAGVPDYKHVIIDKIGRVISEEYKTINQRRDGFFEVSSDYKTMSLLDPNGRLVASGYNDIDEFSDDGIAIAKKQDGKKCWITKEGFEFGSEYKDIGIFAGGYGAVMLEDGKWSYIDKNFKVADVSFDKVGMFEDGYARVKVGEYQYVINTEFQAVAGPFAAVLFRQKGVFAVEEINPENPKLAYAYYNDKGQKISKNYKMLHGFINGLSRVECEKGYNFIDEEGNEILTETFMTAGNFGPRLAWVCKFDENGEHIHNFVDKQGKLFTDWCDMAGGAEDDKPFILKGRRCFYLNDKGKPAGKGYYSLSMTSEGIAHFESSKNKYSFLYEDGSVSTEEFDHVGRFSSGMSVVRNNGEIDAVNAKQHKLSQISRYAADVESKPLKVIRLIDEFADDPETLSMLCAHAIEVLDYASASSEYDDAAKEQFASDKKMIETLKLKTKSLIPEKTAVTTGWEW